MKKTVSLLSVLALMALSVPAFAQDSEPAPAPAPAADCKALKGKEKKACLKAEKDAKKAKKAEKKAAK